MSKETSALPFDADASDLREALEALSVIDTVSVVKESGATLQRGCTWDITFFRPSGYIPKLVLNGKNLAGIGVRGVIDKVHQGKGRPRIYHLTTKATHVDQVQFVRTTASPSSDDKISGGFRLKFYGFETETIHHNAVASVEDESTTWALGTGRGESMEAKIEKVSSLFGISVTVDRMPGDCWKNDDGVAVGVGTCKAADDVEAPLVPECSAEGDCDICVGWCLDQYGDKTDTRCEDNAFCTCTFQGIHNEINITGTCLSSGRPCSTPDHCTRDGSCSFATCAADTVGAFTWKITFHNAPHDMPLLEVSRNDLDIAEGIVVHADVVLSREPRFHVKANRISGDFAISDTLMPFNADPALLAASIEMDSTFRVAVTRTEADLEYGHTWIIAVLMGESVLEDGLRVDGSALQGRGSRVVLLKIRDTTNHGVFKFPEFDDIEMHLGNEERIAGASQTIISGTGNQINFALSGLRYIPETDWHGDVVIVMSIRADHGFGDEHASFENTESIRVTINPVNDIPRIEHPTVVYVDEDGEISIPGMSVVDSDIFEEILNVEMVAERGTIMCSGGKLAGDKLKLSGNINEVNHAISTLTYRPNENENGFDYVDMIVSDATASSAHAMLVNITAINDPPILSGPKFLCVMEDATVAIDGVSLTDVDINETLSVYNASIEFELSAQHGRVYFSTTNGGLAFESDHHELDWFAKEDSDWFRHLRVRATVENIQIPLSTMAYRADRDWYGIDEVVLRVNDLGNSGAGGPRQDVLKIAIEVESVNDPPSIVRLDEESLGWYANISEDDSVSFYDISVDDVDEKYILVPVLKVQTSAAHVDQVQFIRTAADPSSHEKISGGFRLRLLDAVTDLIHHDAVASVDDEATTWALGTGRGESMEAKLEALGLQVSVDRMPGDCWRNDAGDVVSVGICKSTPDVEASLVPECSREVDCDVCMGWCLDNSGSKTETKCSDSSTCDCVFHGMHNEVNTTGTCLTSEGRAQVRMLALVMAYATLALATMIPWGRTRGRFLFMEHRTACLYFKSPATSLISLIIPSFTLT